MKKIVVGLMIMFFVLSNSQLIYAKEAIDNTNETAKDIELKSSNDYSVIDKVKEDSEECIEKKEYEDSNIETTENDIEKNKYDGGNISSKSNENKKGETYKIDEPSKNIQSDENVTNHIEPELKSTSRAVTENFSIYTEVNGNKINPHVKDNINYLFIPKGVDIAAIQIYITGEIENVSGAEYDINNQTITGEFYEGCQITVNTSDNEEHTIILMQSDVPAIFINLDNDVTLETVNANSKDIKYLASINVTGGKKDSYNISQTGIEFKGRGNTTWSMPKKSYQIKLSSKANLLGIGSSKEKKWVLINNYQDPTLLKNKIINDLCVQSGLSSCPNCDYADLYVNGNYVGNYLVCDKIEIKSKRVNLTDPKGVLVELDNAYYNEEEFNFTCNIGNHYTIKEAVSEGDNNTVNEAMKSFNNSLNAFHSELYSDNPSWARIKTMIDVDSFAKYYLINEFAENTDSYFSSCFMYKDGDRDVIHMGPTWDYSDSFGYRAGDASGGNPEVDYTINYAWNNVMRRLYALPEFANKVNEIYNNEVKDAIDNIDIDEITSSIEKSSEINTLVWHDKVKYNSRLNSMKSFFNARKDYYTNRYSNKQIEYSTHVESIGWTKSERSNISGTEGKSLRVEAFKVIAGRGYDESLSISYRSHVQDIGWQNWVRDGQLSGTTGQSKRVEAVQMKLNNSSQYSIRYRVHVQDIGWTDWYYDGDTAGTEGRSLRIEAIQIQIVKKEGLNQDSLINYKGHVENIGNVAYVPNGAILGTTGRSLRLEGVSIVINKELLPNVGFSIDEHIENIGWVRGLTDADYIGTKGQGLRLEAFSIKLTGEDKDKYTVRYRAHVQDIGWQKWSSDGQITGTQGQSKRIEAIQIEIREK